MIKPDDATPIRLFGALADETRLRCVLLIAAHGELCVCDLVEALALPQPKISRHLRLLRDANVVTDRRDGAWVHYRLADDMAAWAHDVIRAVANHHTHAAPYRHDADRLARLAERPGRCAAPARHHA